MLRVVFRLFVEESANEADRFLPIVFKRKGATEERCNQNLYDITAASEVEVRVCIRETDETIYE